MNHPLLFRCLCGASHSLILFETSYRVQAAECIKTRIYNPPKNGQIVWREYFVEDGVGGCGSVLRGHNGSGASALTLKGMKQSINQNQRSPSSDNLRFLFQFLPLVSGFLASCSGCSFERGAKKCVGWSFLIWLIVKWQKCFFLNKLSDPTSSITCFFSSTQLVLL